MELLVTHESPSTAALIAAGHSISTWNLEIPPPTSAHLAIVRGLDEATRATASEIHVLAIVSPDQLDEVARRVRVTDFVVEPVDVAALVARVARICALPPRPLQRLHEIMVLAVERTSDIVEISTPAAVFQYVNAAYKGSLGFSPDEAIGKTPAELVRSDAHSREFFMELDRTLRSGRAWTGTLISKSRDGRLVHFDTTITPIVDVDGRTTHHMAVKRDITEQIERSTALVETNRALEIARDTAVAASRAKSEFLANMSHELRTPLNAILGYSELLLEDLGGDVKIAKDLNRIRSAGQHLLSLINDVLDIAKIEADKVDLLSEVFDLGELVESVAATIQPLASKNHNKFTVTCDRSIGTMVTDHTRLRQVLFNLLSNACKFTKDGRVELAVERKGPLVQIRVMDTGIGISVEQQARLFQPFVQADSSTTRNYGGTGLGLVISRRLVEMMGGRLSIASLVGSGTTFTVELPADASPSMPQLRPRSDKIPVVLLIDDDEAVRELFSRVMPKRGFEVVVASTGPQGIELAARLKPDAIVLDVKMPDMNGWDVLSTLKLSDRTAHLPVIMMTMMQQREIGRALGAVDYLIKPFDAETVTTTLRRHLRGSTASVLVVEDDEPTRDLIARTLKNAGLRVSTAENGRVALDVIDDAAPDIVILDLMMPVMDGFTFLHYLREQPKYATLPVIVATARVLSDVERASLEITAQHVIEKHSHTRQQLLEMIDLEIRAIIARREDAP